MGHDASLQPTCGEMSTLIEEKKGCKEKRVLLFDNDNTLAFVKTGKERRSRRGQGQMGTKQESTFKRRGGDASPDAVMDVYCIGERETSSSSWRTACRATLYLASWKKIHYITQS